MLTGARGCLTPPTSCHLRCSSLISEAAGFEVLSPVRREAGAPVGAGGSHEAFLRQLGQLGPGRQALCRPLSTA